MGFRFCRGVGRESSSPVSDGSDGVGRLWGVVCVEEEERLRVSVFQSMSTALLSPLPSPGVVSFEESKQGRSYYSVGMYGGLRVKWQYLAEGCLEYSVG